MSDEVQPEITTPATETPAAEAPAREVSAPAQAAEPAAAEAPKPKPEGRPQGQRPQGQQKREDRPPRPDNRGGGGQQREGRPPGDRPQGDRRPGGDRREGGRPSGGRPFDMQPEIELEKLISDSLYLDNQAHAVVARMRDMDSGTKSQLRRLYNAVRRAVRAPEAERQHHFVMLRARLAYTIARHSLRSLDALERLLLQVTRRNDARGYERFKDLFEAIVAYNE
jgi:CRISPR type III-A-associated protein Csm2